MNEKSNEYFCICYIFSQNSCEHDKKKVNLLRIEFSSCNRASLFVEN